MTPAKLGQHFLSNRGVAEKIVNLIMPGDTPILEIGPGRGILTDLILNRFPDRRIVAVEKDGDLAVALSTRLAPPLEIIHSDILTLVPEAIFPGHRFTLVGNIPYLISKKIIDWVISRNSHIHQGVMMMQKEFVKKVTPPPGIPGPGAQAVIFTHLFHAHPHFDVNPGSFQPPPRVVSTVITFEYNHPDLSRSDILLYYDFLKLCFRNRRKTLYNNLRDGFGEPVLREVSDSTGVDLNRRAQDLLPPAFLSLFRELAESEKVAAAGNGKKD